ncbi:LacI family DNA-binding transcriptional regulator [Corynebacterium pacaense]|uniref:LacI family DNA-binding transcriptional regulator n=1 Tax=Corynebacterium pacaense TaxID=1816684 RepID=UPI0015C44582|nr:LacI family DNA-binding transcriptional regulator [Corynebacterium pacaense]
MADKRATIADVAARAGTSITTVSLVLNKRKGSRISESTARRIHEAAEELNYSANPTARSLRTKKSRTIGFISDEVTVTRYASALIRGCIDVAERTGNTVLISECSFGADPLSATIEAMNTRNVDALVFALMRAHHIEIPTLPASVNAVILNGTATVAQPGENPWNLPSVLPDEFEAGITAGRRLTSAGHRHIALIGRDDRHGDPAFSVTVTERMRGLDTALAEEGLRFRQEIHDTEWEPELGYRGAMEILGRNNTLPVDERITAIVAGNDRIAFGVYQAAQRCNYSIPRELSVISFDNEILATYLRPGLTTLELPYLEMGLTGTSLILEPTTLRRHKNDRTSLLVPMPLIERESIAPPPTGVRTTPTG